MGKQGRPIPGLLMESVTAVARKRPGSFSQKCRWQVTHKHAHTLDQTKSKWAVTGNKLTRNLSGNIRPQSSQFAKPLWTDPGIKNGTGVREPISPPPKKKKKKKKRKKAQAGNKWSDILSKSSRVMCWLAGWSCSAG